MEVESRYNTLAMFSDARRHVSVMPETLPSLDAHWPDGAIPMLP